MTKEMKEFATEVKVALKEFGKEVEIEEIKKNGLTFTGICEKNAKVVPIVYLNDFYEEYETGKKNFLEIVKEINEIMDAEVPSYDLNFLGNYDIVKEKLFLRSFHYENLPEDCIYTQTKDLCGVPYILLDENSSTIVKKAMLNEWGVDEKTLILDTLKSQYNMGYECISLIEMIKKETGMDISETENAYPMYILTNSRKIHGAGIIFNEKIMKEVENIVGKKFYILPSSIHEVLLVPSNFTKEKYEHLTQMVGEVNSECVSEEEILSDHAYYYENGVIN